MSITQYVIIAVLVAFGLMGGEIYLLKKDNRQLIENEGIFKAQIDELSRSIQAKDRDIKLSNERVDALVVEGVKRAGVAEKARKDARGAGEKNRQLSDQLLQFKRKEGENSCNAANRLIDEYIDRMSQ